MKFGFDALGEKCLFSASFLELGIFFIRKILVSRSSKPEISDWITLRGSITEADAKKNSFTILPIAGRLLPTEIPEGFWEVISQALNNYRIEQGKVAVQCLQKNF